MKDPAVYVPYKIIPKDVQQTEECTIENWCKWTGEER
jgi:hypothetical protein